MSTEQQAAAGAATTTTTEKNLLDELVNLTRPQDDTDRTRNKSYLDQFIRQAIKPGQVVSKDTETNIKFWINEIDKKLSSQLNEVMHAPEFQKMESTWRGLHYLVHQSETSETLKIRVLNVSKRDLFKDLEKAIEFDQSSLFKKIYEDEYGILGGEPFGILVGDYEFGRGAEDVAMVDKIAKVAAASHAPFVAAASPGMATSRNIPS